MMKDHIETRVEPCTGCDQCVRECPMETADIAYQDEIFGIMNRLAMILLAVSNEERFEDSLLQGMELIGKHLGADSIRIWSNEMRGGVLHFVLTYSWLSDAGVPMPSVEAGMAIPYSGRLRELFLRDEYLNGPVADLPQEDRELLQALGLKSTITVPLFYREEFWGLLCVDDYKRERYFSGVEAGMLHSTALMLVNAINREQQASQIRDSAARLQAIVANYPGAICSVDKDYNMTLFDGLLVPYIVDKDLFFAGQDLNVALQKDEFKHIMVNLRKTWTDGPQDWSFEANGKVIHMMTTQVIDDKGVATGLMAKIEDITGMIRMQKDLETALQKAEAALDALKAAQSTTSAMFESNPQINILFDEGFNAIDCNPAAEEFMGFATKAELLAGVSDRLAESIPEYQPDGKRSIPLRECLEITAAEGYVNFDAIISMLGVQRNLDVEFRKIPYGNGFAIVCYIDDVTEIKTLISEIERQRMVAEAANKAKSSFLSTMSHEIRTPMNAIMGITEIQLQNEQLDQNEKDAFEKIHTSSDLLLGIINDILDLSKIEAGKLELSISEYDVASLISDTAQLNMMRAGSKPILFELLVDENIPVQLSGDGLRIKQILNNLLSNAFKYTAEGTVKLSIDAEPGDSGDDSIILAISVSDTGQGMDNEQIDRLFDEYARFNVESNRSTEGTGLGMSITRNLVRLMGGEIAVESEPGKGSVFNVRIPQCKIDTGTLGREMVENLKRFRTSSRAQMKRVQITRTPMPYGSVLVVDDVETNIYVAKGLLAPYELKIESADSGIAAIDIIKNGNEYDIIFMDHMMPKMDGIEATKIIRDSGYELPIVALTANAVSGQADMFLKNGFDAFISKPIDIRQLNAVLNKLIRDKQSPETLRKVDEQVRERKASGSKAQAGIEPRFAEVFVRDAMKAIAAIGPIAEKKAYSDWEDLRAYIVNIHGLKSALANIGKTDMSAEASRLESAGRKGQLDVMISQTPPFLESLRAVVAELSPQKAEDFVSEADEDKQYLSKMLLTIKGACEEYDDNAAEAALQEIRKTTWSQQTSMFLSLIAERLLHSEFDEIAEIVKDWLA